MNLEGMSKKELLELVMELAGSLKEEDLHEPDTYAMVGQLLDILDDSAHTLPQEMIDQLKHISSKPDLFRQAVQMAGLTDPSQLESLAQSLKQAGLLKSEDINDDLYKATPFDLTDSHILMFPVKIKGQNKSEDPDIPEYHITLKWLGTNKPVEHDKVQEIVKKHKLHPPKITHVEPLTWANPRGDIHVLALHGDHDNLHSAHEELSSGNKSIHPYTPHITVSKDLHDKVKSGAITAADLGFEVGPLEYKIGGQSIKTFKPAPEAEEHFNKNEHHPIHYNLKDRKHYRAALKHSDLQNLGKSEGKPLASPTKNAIDYAKSKGLTYKHDLPFHKVNPEKATKIAKAYDTLSHQPNHPDVKKSYKALIHETTEQFRFLQGRGLKISKIKPGQENPYKGGSKDVRKDIHENNHLWFFPTDQGYGSEDGTDVSDHPMLSPTSIHHEGEPIVANDLFRIVHDYFGHSPEGHSFNAHGEDNAWKHHCQLYTPEARKALTTETRGQNSWVNYGPHGTHNQTNPRDTIYAPQKAALMPDFAMEYEDEPTPELNKSINGDWKEDKKYRFKHHEYSGARGQSIRVYHGSKRIGHLAFSSDSRGDGYHAVFNSEIDKDHRGKGIYQEMLRLAGEKAVERGSKGLKSEGYQRSISATRAWDKVATHAEPFTNNWKVGNMEGRKRETNAYDTDYILEPNLKKTLDKAKEILKKHRK